MNQRTWSSLTAFVAATALCNAVLAQNPQLEMKGMTLGMSKAQLIEGLPGIRCKEDSCYFSLELTCKVASAEDKQACERSAEKLRDYGGAPAKNYVATFHDDVLTSASVSIPEASFRAVVAALTEKYGKPTSSTTETVTNRMAAAFDNQTVTWRRPNGAIQAVQRASTIDQSRIGLLSSDFLAKQEARRTIDAKKGAKSL